MQFAAEFVLGWLPATTKRVFVERQGSASLQAIRTCLGASVIAAFATASWCAPLTRLSEQTSSPLPRAAAPEVVVTAHRADLDRTLSALRSMSASSAGQITRFETAVCPVAIGLPQAQAAVVQARIREIAKQAGLAEAKVGCDPNLVVAIAEDGQAFVRELRRRHPGLFSDLSLHEWERLEAWPGPAWSWRMTRAARRDGVP